MTLCLIVGLPGAGKTRRARELEVAVPALRLTPDEWLVGVFPGDGPDRWRAPDRVEQRDRIEGLLIGAGLRAARLGVHVVLDLGLWGRDERSALRWLAADAGIFTQVVYLPVDHEEQRRRIADRIGRERGQFAMTEADLRQWRSQFEVPDAGELSGAEIPPVPPGHATWRDWAAERWPSLPTAS